MSNIIRYASIIAVCAVIVIVCYLTFSAYNRTELTFDDVANASEEFTFVGAEVNGKHYKGQDEIIRLVKGQELQIKVSFSRRENAGMVKPGTVRIFRPFGNDGVEVLQSASFDNAKQEGKTFTVSASLTIPEEAPAGKALLSFASGERTYVELTTEVD